MRPRVEILLPGLFDLPFDELGESFCREQLPALNRLLRFASPRPNRAFSIDAMLQGALGWPVGEHPGDDCLPLAQAWADSTHSEADRSLLFEAVHLRPDLQNAVLVPVEKNKENLHDIDNIINDLKEFFKVNCSVSALHHGSFVMGLRDFPAPRHYPHILSVLGKTANPYMDQSRANLPWYRLLNEMQMFLHQHPLNATRLQQGRLPLNSLWFWGGGVRPAAPASSPGWYCDDPILNRFAASLDLVTAPSSEARSMQGAAIIIELRLLEALKMTGEQDLRGLLREIERDLVAPVVTAAERSRQSLRLRAGFEFDFELTARSRYRFWRRPTSVADWSASPDSGPG